MTDSIEEKIISAIVSALAAIKVSSGYNTDAGMSIKRGLKLTDKDQLPGLSVMPGTESNNPIPGKNQLTLRVRIEGLQKYMSQNPSSLAIALKADIIKRMTNPSLTSADGGYADKVQYAEGGVEDYPEPGQYTIACYAAFDIVYKTKLGNPYSQ